MARLTVYSDEEKAAALETLILCGGNIAEVHRILGIPESTLRQWARGQCVSDSVYAAYAAKKAGRMTAVVRALNARLAEALFAEEKIESARYGELVTAFGVTFDKLRLMDSQPTQITESRDAIRERALDLLARLVASGLDRRAAILALRERAPTLSRYIEALPEAVEAVEEAGVTGAAGAAGAAEVAEVAGEAEVAEVPEWPERR